MVVDRVVMTISSRAICILDQDNREILTLPPYESAKANLRRHQLQPLICRKPEFPKTEEPKVELECPREDCGKRVPLWLRKLLIDIEASPCWQPLLLPELLLTELLLCFQRTSSPASTSTTRSRRTR